MRPRISITGAGAENYVGHALAFYRRFEDSGQSHQTLKIDNATILLAKGDVKVINDDAAGFLFHPRSASFPHGLLPDGTAITRPDWTDGDGGVHPAIPYPYPLIDDDHGTRNLSFDGSDWTFTVDPPEDYGNISWVGKAVGTAVAPIITWRGPPSFALDPLVEIPGLATYDDETDLTTYYSPFKPVMYQGGVGSTVPGKVLGAAIHFATGCTIAMLWNGYRDATNPAGGIGGHFFELWVNNSTKVVPGWERVFFTQQFRPSMPWYFNASGTEAQAVDGFRFKIIVGYSTDTETGITTFAGTFTSVSLALATLTVTASNATVNTSNTPPVTTNPDSGFDIRFYSELPGSMGGLTAWIDKFDGESNTWNKQWGRNGETVVDVRYDGDKEIVTTVLIESNTSNVEHTNNKDNIYGLVANTYTSDGTNPWDGPLTMRYPALRPSPGYDSISVYGGCKVVITTDGITLNSDGLVTAIGCCDATVTGTEPCTGRTVTKVFPSIMNDGTITGRDSVPTDGAGYSVTDASGGIASSCVTWSISGSTGASIDASGNVTVTDAVCGETAIITAIGCGKSLTKNVTLPNLGHWITTANDSTDQCYGWGAGACTFYPDSGLSYSETAPNRAYGNVCHYYAWREYREEGGDPCASLVSGGCTPARWWIPNAWMIAKVYSHIVYEWSCG